MENKTGVQVTTGFFPLAFILFLCTPVVEINGKPNRTSWGTAFFETLPGNNDVKVYFPYLFFPQCGANSISVNVKQGQVVKIKFYMPPWMLAKGSLREVA
jgi:hypothetical protein